MMFQNNSWSKDHTHNYDIVDPFFIVKYLFPYSNQRLRKSAASGKGPHLITERCLILVGSHCVHAVHYVCDNRVSEEVLTNAFWSKMGTKIALLQG